MAGFNFAAGSAILQEDYQGPIRESVNLATAFLAQIQRKPVVDVGGKRAFIPVHVSRSEAIGWRGDGGTLPVANAQGYTDVLIPVKYGYGAIRISGPAMKATENHAFLRAVDSETKGMAKELKEAVDRQLCRNDSLGSGVLATLATNGSGTTLNLQGADAGTALILRQGINADFQTGGTVNTTSDAITGVTLTAGIPTAITVASAAATTAGDVITYTGDYQKELIGIAGIVANTGVLHSVDPSVYPVWQSSVLAAAGAPLSEPLMQSIMSSVAIASGEDPNAIVVQQTQRDKFSSLMKTMKRAVNTLDLKGGFKSLTFNDDIPLLVDRFISPTSMYFVNLDNLALYVEQDWEWADEDGSVLSRSVDGTDSFTAFMRNFSEFGTDQRNAHGVITGLGT